MVKSKTGKGNENRGESFITFKERKFGEGDNHPKKFRITKSKEEKHMKKMMRKLGENFAALALIVGLISTSQVCHYFLNQPEVPESMKKMLEDRKR